MLLIGIRQALYASTEIADYCPLGKVRADQIDEYFRLIGEMPAYTPTHVHGMFAEGFRKELGEPQLIYCDPHHKLSIRYMLGLGF